MQTFKDSEGAVWSLSLTIGKIRQMKEILNLDLLNHNHFLKMLESLTDRLSFVYLLCKSQADERKLNIDEFEERLYGENVSYDASDAFLKECESFFQKLGTRGQQALAEMALKSMAAGRANTAQLIDSGQFALVVEAQIGSIDSYMNSLPRVPAVPVTTGAESSNLEPLPE